MNRNPPLRLGDFVVNPISKFTSQNNGLYAMCNCCGASRSEPARITPGGNYITVTIHETLADDLLVDPFVKTRGWEAALRQRDFVVIRDKEVGDVLLSWADKRAKERAGV